MDVKARQVTMRLALLFCSHLFRMHASVSLYANVVSGVQGSLQSLIGMSLKHRGACILHIHTPVSPGADVVSGVQGSLQSLFGMSSYVAALACSDLAAFPWLMAASCSVVLTGARAGFLGLAPPFRTSCCSASVLWPPANRRPSPGSGPPPASSSRVQHFHVS